MDRGAGERVNVLAIGAHPDDIEFLCGGTLALYARAGHKVYMAIATNGEVGSATLSKDEITAVRHAEAQASCDVIGAQLIWMGFPDEWLFNDRETRTRFIDAIREARPDVMFVHSVNDYHPDHCVSGQVAVDARIPATVRLVETALPPAEKIPHIFFMDTIGGSGFAPESYVDITSVIDVKREMLLKHESQDAWLQHVLNMSYGEFMESHARVRGMEIVKGYAEAFVELKSYPRTGSAAMLPAPA